MYEGIDTAARITAAQAAKLREQGVSFVCRYIGPESWGKTITRDEVGILHDAGLAILLCYETSAARMRGGARAGAEDGHTARQAAEELGCPSGTVIFTVRPFMGCVESNIMKDANAVGEFVIVKTVV